MCNQKEGRLRMSPRTGRPTDDPKGNQTRIRMSDRDLQKLEYTAKALGVLPM